MVSLPSPGPTCVGSPLDCELPAAGIESATVTAANAAYRLRIRTFTAPP